MPHSAHSPQSAAFQPPPKAAMARTAAAAVVVLAALAVGWPAVRGGYLSGDDENLIFNHGLVNRPSLAHAAELFRIIHRDLYQPIPLLTFQLEFAAHEPGAGSLERLV